MLLSGTNFSKIKIWTGVPQRGHEKNPHFGLYFLDEIDKIRDSLKLISFFFGLHLNFGTTL